ncbi:MAG: hypothetical protein FJY75_04130 [Candidatus Eisenbacteria bacterium]|uniref:Uncharacterized protein n=1 Tax=Eiseniibacteriota bacterium TaxID=2212470 RepID=A0A937XAW3_UNCEI|nr:hypothetical protein [Candidatus Eisenbacteria bacterium]
MAEELGILVGALLTLAIFSLLYRDNPFYRAAEHLLVGVSAGYYVVHYFYAAVIRKFTVPVFQQGEWWLLPGGLLGLLIFFRLRPRTAWLSRYAIAFYVAAWSGYLIPSVLQERVLTQIAGTIPDPAAAAPWALAMSLLVLVGVASILVYFYFSAAHTGALGRISRVGILFLMAGFGASFGYTVMGRVSLLIGRFQYLFEDLPRALGRL